MKSYISCYKVSFIIRHNRVFYEHDTGSYAVGLQMPTKGSELVRIA